MNSKPKKIKKTQDLALAGSTSAFTLGAGVSLMIFGGPVAGIFGGMLCGAGISGSFSTGTQAFNDKTDFDFY
jgi:hypothetical protein